MSDQPDSNFADPFLRIIEILVAWHDYRLNAIKATCYDRAAWTLANAAENFSTYFLEGDGAEEATHAFQRFLEGLPPPHSASDFSEAMKQARQQAAAARLLPLNELVAAFELIDTDHAWARNMKVIPRGEFVQLFPGWELTGLFPK